MGLQNEIRKLLNEIRRGANPITARICKMKIMIILMNLKFKKQHVEIYSILHELREIQHLAT